MVFAGTFFYNSVVTVINLSSADPIDPFHWIQSLKFRRKVHFLTYWVIPESL